MSLEAIRELTAPDTRGLPHPRASLTVRGARLQECSTKQPQAAVDVETVVPPLRDRLLPAPRLSLLRLVDQHQGRRPRTFAAVDQHLAPGALGQ